MSVFSSFSLILRSSSTAAARRGLRLGDAAVQVLVGHELRLGQRLRLRRLRSDLGLRLLLGVGPRRRWPLRGERLRALGLVQDLVGELVRDRVHLLAAAEARAHPDEASD